jgi:hypothetical protein
VALRLESGKPNDAVNIRPDENDARELMQLFTIVFLAVLTCLLFVALVLYIRQHPFPGFGGFTNIVIITACYAFFAFVVPLSPPRRRQRPGASCYRSARRIDAVSASSSSSRD